MQTIRVKPDQWMAIGEGLTFAVTDIDAAGVRVLLRGQIIGGPEDGATIDRAAEIAPGSEVRVGIITIALIDVRPAFPDPTAKLGVYAPQHVAIRPLKEPK